MPHFIVEYTYSPAAASGRDAHRAAHRTWLAGLVARGTVLSCGPYGDDAGALIIVEAPAAGDVERLFAEDPFFLHGLVAGCRVTPWAPVLGQFAPA